MVNSLVKKIDFSTWKNCTFVFDVIMVFYISLPNWPNINTFFTMVDREGFSFFRVDQRIQKSGQLCYVLYTT